MSRRQRQARSKRRRHARAGTAAAVGGLAAVGTLLSGSAAEAAVIPCQVTNLEGVSVYGSLAFEMDRASVDGCTDNAVTFAPSLSGTIDLSTPLPAITYVQGETIRGPGSGQVTIQPSGAALGAPIFKTNGAPSAAISGFTINGASATTGPAIYNSAGTALTLSDLTVTDSHATGDGGAIYSQQGSGASLTIEHSTLDDNVAAGNGGAIFSSAPVTIEDSTVSNNRAGFGGGIYAVGGLTLEQTTVSGNTATVFAGGLLAGGSVATVAIADSTISDNTSLGNVGGVFAGPAGGGSMTFSMTDSTVADNRANHDAGMDLGMSTTPVTVQGSTITGNVATTEFGGIYAYANTFSDTLDLDSSVVAGNVAPLYSDVYSPIVAADHSFIGDPTGVTFVSQSHDIVGTATAPANPLLGPLAANGGPVETEVPQPGSPLIDAGAAFGQTTDARGFGRSVLLLGPAPAGGDGTDIGAAELQASEAGAPTVTAVSSTSGAAGTVVMITGTNLFTATGVSFGGVPATFTAVSATELRATAPSGPTGSVDVQVTTPAGQSAGSGGDSFTYPTPTPPPGSTTTNPAPPSTTTTPPSTTPTTPTTSTPTPIVKAETSTVSASFGNQRLRLTAPGASSCTAKSGSAKVTFKSTAVKKSKAAKLKLKSVDFYIDKGVAHKTTKTVGGKKKTVTTYKPNATSNKAPVTENLKLKGLKSGTHTLKATASYTKTVKAHGKTKTSTTSKTLRSTLKVC